ncbi:3749_t:CDS:2 [Ambispora leptoticha]|uniref:3749_t:CDS:1 n=1 Tax=Ambispora leptoticha TaxID=144679 RepID=A0A9N9AUV1_9GLOM|nr:3749_t:CDS:2 [Ambispora leptoticha]
MEDNTEFFLIHFKDSAIAPVWRTIDPEDDRLQRVVNKFLRQHDCIDACKPQSTTNSGQSQLKSKHYHFYPDDNENSDDKGNSEQKAHREDNEMDLISKGLENMNIYFYHDDNGNSDDRGNSEQNEYGEDNEMDLINKGLKSMEI